MFETGKFQDLDGLLKETCSFYVIAIVVKLTFLDQSIKLNSCETKEKNHFFVQVPHQKKL